MSTCGARTSIGEAAAFVALNDPDAAFATLDEAVTAHVSSLLWLRVAPELEPLRTDARFERLLDRMHWPRGNGTL
jgi:hypothetical protein